MQVIINIPDEFVADWNKDRFDDALHRLSADAHLIAGNYEQETAKMLADAFKNAAQPDLPIKEKCAFCPHCNNCDVNDDLSIQPCVDTISRKAAINAILAVTGNSSVRELYEHVQEHGLSDMWSGGVNAAIDIIIAVPSAQPEKRTEERTETHACDLISRQAAIDALDKRFDSIPMEQTTEILLLRKDLRALPSAQPEVLARGEGELIAQPEIVLCKDCKHWKDSDGVYRRGIGAESKCPVNIRAVYEGNFYCADAERRTDET